MWIWGRTKAYRLLSSNEGRHICFVVVTSFSYLVFTDVGLDIAVMCADISVQRHCDFSQLVWVRYHAPINVKGGINPCMLLYLHVATGWSLLPGSNIMYAPNTMKGGSNSFQHFVDVCEVTFCVITLCSLGLPTPMLPSNQKGLYFTNTLAEQIASGFHT